MRWIPEHVHRHCFRCCAQDRRCPWAQQAHPVSGCYYHGCQWWCWCEDVEIGEEALRICVEGCLVARLWMRSEKWPPEVSRSFLWTTSGYQTHAGCFPQDGGALELVVPDFGPWSQPLGTISSYSWGAGYREKYQSLVPSLCVCVCVYVWERDWFSSPLKKVSSLTKKWQYEKLLDLCKIHKTIVYTSEFNSWS